MVDLIQRALTSVEYDQVHHPDLGLQERVLAYELYHQFRRLESEGVFDIRPARLQAELDKRAQRYFGDGETIPDLLVHAPGFNDTNRLVLELKRVERGQTEAEADLNKLAKFIREPLAYAQRCLVLCCEDGGDWGAAGGWIRNWQDQGPVQIEVISFDARNRRVSCETVGWQDPRLLHD